MIGQERCALIGCAFGTLGRGPELVWHGLCLRCGALEVWTRAQPEGAMRQRGNDKTTTRLSLALHLQPFFPVALDEEIGTTPPEQALLPSGSARTSPCLALSHPLSRLSGDCLRRDVCGFGLLVEVRLPGLPGRGGRKARDLPQPGPRSEAESERERERAGRECRRSGGVRNRENVRAFL